MAPGLDGFHADRRALRVLLQHAGWHEVEKVIPGSCVRASGVIAASSGVEPVPPTCPLQTIVPGVSVAALPVAVEPGLLEEEAPPQALNAKASAIARPPKPRLLCDRKLFKTDLPPLS